MEKISKKVGKNEIPKYSILSQKSISGNVVECISNAYPKQYNTMDIKKNPKAIAPGALRYRKLTAAKYPFSRQADSRIMLRKFKNLYGLGYSSSILQI
jgi:hypothetical protein